MRLTLLLMIGALYLLPACVSPRRIAPPSGPQSAEAAVGEVLDALHRAAAEADGETYFSLFAENAVFLGTDATERWTIGEFREFAAPYFEKESAWTYTPRERHVDLLPGGTVAYFDELLDQAKYGECRGTGVLERIEGHWRIRQYHLTFPIPNAIAGAVTRWIQQRELGTRWVFVVRHAEKGSEGDDPTLTTDGRARARRLSTILGDAPLQAVISSEYRRTRNTVAPAAAAHGLKVETISARKPGELLARLDALPAGSAALVSGHSNTVPALLKALGVETEVTLGDSDYGDLFAVRRGSGGVELLRLGF